MDNDTFAKGASHYGDMAVIAAARELVHRQDRGDQGLIEAFEKLRDAVHCYDALAEVMAKEVGLR